MNCKSIYLAEAIKNHVKNFWKTQPVPGKEVDDFYNWYQSDIRWQCFPLSTPDRVPSPAPLPDKPFQTYRAPKQTAEPKRPDKDWERRTDNIFEKQWQYFERAMEIAYKYREIISIGTWALIVVAIALGLAASGPSAGTSLAAALATLILLLLPYVDQFDAGEKAFLQGNPQASNIKIDEASGTIVMDNIRITVEQKAGAIDAVIEKIDESRVGAYDGLVDTEIKKDDEGRWSVRSEDKCVQGSTKENKLVRDGGC